MLSAKQNNDLFHAYVEANNRGWSFEHLGRLIREIAHHAMTEDVVPCHAYAQLLHYANTSPSGRALRPFDSDDWDTFAGCTTDEPEVCYIADYRESGDVVGLALILDGCVVQLVIGEDSEDTFMGEYATPDVARLVADKLLQLKDDHADLAARDLGMKLI